MAADDVNFANPTLEGALGRFQFQNHAAGNDAGLHEVVNLFARDGGEDLIAVQDAGDIGKVNEMVRSNEFGTSGSHMIGIDIVEFTVGAKAKAGCNRNELFPPK